MVGGLGRAAIGLDDGHERAGALRAKGLVAPLRRSAAPQIRRELSQQIDATVDQSRRDGVNTTMRFRQRQVRLGAGWAVPQLVKSDPVRW
ncbi:hypothetical protein B0I32_1664 [Nonomuraea fuscirosea]|uniref:Uncharacterized protein n=1 Tax=Nonomuraea fuscirosea TaxID=1291556 RepID=A0A2T0LJX0_9ACTN|nr:hypothetical protein B0I32_1664 [Nonomuraea fuscirosea]